MDRQSKFNIGEGLGNDLMKTKRFIVTGCSAKDGIARALHDLMKPIDKDNFREKKRINYKVVMMIIKKSMGTR